MTRSLLADDQEQSRDDDPRLQTNGTTDLFAAANVVTSEVLYDRKWHHGAAEVLSFFKLMDLHMPKELEFHTVLDKLSAHKTEPVHRWFRHEKRAC